MGLVVSVMSPHDISSKKASILKSCLLQELLVGNNIVVSTDLDVIFRIPISLFSPAKYKSK